MFISDKNEILRSFLGSHSDICSLLVFKCQPVNDWWTKHACKNVFFVFIIQFQTYLQLLQEAVELHRSSEKRFPCMYLKTNFSKAMIILTLVKMMKYYIYFPFRVGMVFNLFFKNLKSFNSRMNLLRLIEGCFWRNSFKLFNFFHGISPWEWDPLHHRLTLRSEYIMSHRIYFIY